MLNYYLKITFALCILLLLSLPGISGDNVQRVSFTGRAYDLETGRLLFMEKNEEQQKNTLTRASKIVFTDPKGKVFAEQEARFTGRLSAPEYKFVDYRDGHYETVNKVEGGFRVGFKRNSREDWIYETLTEPALHTIPGFRNFIVLRWNTLLRGESLSFKSILVPNKDYYTFRVRKIEETKVNNRPAYVFKISIANLLLLMLSDSLFLTIDKESKQLMRYQGVHYIRDTEDWQGLTVRIDYDYSEQLQ